MLPHNKIYLSRAQTKSMSAYEPIGDPTGGAAYGEFNDPMTAAVVGGTQIIGGMMASDAASEAAGQQAAGQRYSADLQRQMFETQNAQQAPYRQAGGAALNKMNYLLGLDTGAKTYDQYRQELLPQYTTSGSTSPSVLGGIRSSKSSPMNFAAGFLGDPSNGFGEVGQSVSGYLRGQQSTPSINESALDAAIRARMSADAAAPKGEDFGKYSDEFSLADFQQDPGYAFRLKMGQDQAMRQANLGGGALSGNALSSLQDYTQGSASQEFGNAFNRYQTDKTNIFNRLASIAGLGQTSLQNTGNQSVTAGSNIGSAYGNAASAQAAGTVGATNALVGGLTGAGNSYMLSSLLKPQATTSAPVGGFTGSDIGNISYALKT